MRKVLVEEFLNGSHVLEESEEQLTPILISSHQSDVDKAQFLRQVFRSRYGTRSVFVRGLQTAEEWTAQYMQRAPHAGVIICIVSAAYLQDEECMCELEAALADERVVPVRMESTDSQCLIQPVELAVELAAVEELEHQQSEVLQAELTSSELQHAAQLATEAAQKANQRPEVALTRRMESAAKTAVTAASEAAAAAQRASDANVAAQGASDVTAIEQYARNAEEEAQEATLNEDHARNALKDAIAIKAQLEGHTAVGVAMQADKGIPPSESSRCCLCTQAQMAKGDATSAAKIAARAAETALSIKIEIEKIQEAFMANSRLQDVLKAADEANAAAEKAASAHATSLKALSAAEHALQEALAMIERPDHELANAAQGSSVKTVNSAIQTFVGTVKKVLVEERATGQTVRDAADCRYHLYMYVQPDKPHLRSQRALQRQLLHTMCQWKDLAVRGYVSSDSAARTAQQLTVWGAQCMILLGPGTDELPAEAAPYFTFDAPGARLQCPRIVLIVTTYGAQRSARSATELLGAEVAIWVSYDVMGMDGPTFVHDCLLPFFEDAIALGRQSAGELLKKLRDFGISGHECGAEPAGCEDVILFPNPPASGKPMINQNMAALRQTNTFPSDVEPLLVCDHEALDRTIEALASSASFVFVNGERDAKHRARSVAFEACQRFVGALQFAKVMYVTRLYHLEGTSISATDSVLLWIDIVNVGDARAMLTKLEQMRQEGYDLTAVLTVLHSTDTATIQQYSEMCTVSCNKNESGSLQMSHLCHDLRFQFEGQTVLEVCGVEEVRFHAC